MSLHLTQQQSKIIRAFRRADGKRLSTTQLAELFIPRYGARIMELRRAGFMIDKTHENGKWVYQLLSEPEDVRFDVERCCAQEAPSSSSREPAETAPASRLSPGDSEGWSPSRSGAAASLSVEPTPLFEVGTPKPQSAIYGDMEAA